MLSKFIPNDRTRENLQRQRCGADLKGFSEWLTSFRYSAETIRSYIFAAARYDAWVRGRHHDIASALAPSELDAYRAYLTHRHPDRRRPDGGNDYCGAHRFVKYLRERGGIQVDVARQATSLERRFVDWLCRHRGACLRTAEGYALKVRRLLSALGSDPRLYSAAQLRDNVLAQSRGYSDSHVDAVVTSVRMFVRFLIIHQECSESLQYAIPRVAKWQKASLPRYLCLADVQRIIDTCDPGIPLRARDRAILLMLSRLGLRAGDVAGLSLGDIDWTRARIRVSGKSRIPAWLPLPQDAGDALLHYIQTARPDCSSDAVFLISCAPYTRVLTRQICLTAERAIRRAGVKTSSLGAHQFRHSAATAWLNQGMTLQAIGAVLRHRDVDTTALYAKVDVNLLRGIALPWPQEVVSC
jgi:site-specific recombinase XerD